MIQPRRTSPWSANPSAIGRLKSADGRMLNNLHGSKEMTRMIHDVEAEIHQLEEHSRKKEEEWSQEHGKGYYWQTEAEETRKELPPTRIFWTSRSIKFETKEAIFEFRASDPWSRREWFTHRGRKAPAAKKTSWSVWQLAALGTPPVGLYGWSSRLHVLYGTTITQTSGNIVANESRQLAREAIRLLCVVPQLIPNAAEGNNCSRHHQNNWNKHCGEWYHLFWRLHFWRYCQQIATLLVETPS